MQTFETPSAFLASLGGPRRRMLALGEPTHGVEEFLLLRNEFFKDLVELEGYTAIAIESDCLAGLMVDDYVSTGQGSLDEVMGRGFSHDFGRMRANRELVEWMRGKPLRFFGFDAPIEMAAASSPRESLVALHGFLGRTPYSLETIEELLGDDVRWTNPEAMRDPSKSVGATEDAARLRLIADDLRGMLLSELPRLAQAGPELLWRARLHARTATGLLRYHAAMAESSTDRLSRLTQARDAMMAENLLAIAEEHHTLVFAHNAHLQRRLSGMMFGGQDLAWWSAGAIAAATLGDRYAFITSALGTSPAYGGAPGPDTLEGLLSSVAAPGTIVHSARFAEIMPAAPTMRAADYRYSPLDPDKVRDSEGIVYVNVEVNAAAS